MPLLVNIGQLATCRPAGSQDQIWEIPKAALAWEGSTIRWVGPETELPDEYRQLETWDAGGGLVIPGLIDCHTHLCFSGWRADEFELKIRGADYLEIARKGGGIHRTVRMTRRACREELAAHGLRALREMSRLGITTVECKSGYGLDGPNEIKLLEVYRELAESQPLRIVPTFLGAHIVPEEFLARRQDYIRLLTEELIPEIGERRLARFCDVFVEEGAFTREEARAILGAGRRFGLVPKLHVDQLSDGGGGCLAAEVGAISADHLEQVSADGIEAMAEAGVIAVALPIASLYLGRRPLPARSLVEAGVRLAVATDFNPGTAPTFHLPLAMMLACTMARMTPGEVLKGATIYSAAALALEARVGSLEPGKDADFAVIDSPDVNEWMYHFRPNACTMTIVQGRAVWGAH